MRLISNHEINKSTPTEGIANEVKQIFNRSSDLEKQQFCLDPLLLPHLSPTMQPKVVVLSTKCAPMPIDKEIPYSTYLLSLTNFGACSIKFKEFSNPLWDIEVADISTIWKNYYKEQNITKFEQINKFDALQAIMHDIVINAFCWNSQLLNNVYNVACASISGILIVFEVARKYINQPDVCKITFVTDLKLSRIIQLRWFTFTNVKNKQESFICCADLLGNVYLFLVQLNTSNEIESVVKKSDLYAHNDEIRVGGIYMDFDAENERLICIVCKGAHLLSFFINTHSYKVVMQVHDTEHLFISGR